MVVLYTETHTFKDVLTFVTRSERVCDILTECAWRMFKSHCLTHGMTKTEWDDIELEAGGRFCAHIAVEFDKETFKAMVVTTIVDEWSD